VLLSSNVRLLGIYGIATAAALGPVAALAGSLHAGRSVALVATSLMAGLLTGGHFYAEPSITWFQAGVLFLAPAATFVASKITVKTHARARGVIAVVLVAAVVGALAVPAAINAKHEAEKTSDDPYANSYGN
jgi:hypothetical protein